MQNFYALRISIGALLGALGLLLAAPGARAQAPIWQTAVAVNGAASMVTATAIDASGNVHVAGYFTGTVSFGATTLTSAGDRDVFVAKWSRASAALCGPNGREEPAATMPRPWP